MPVTDTHLEPFDAVVLMSFGGPEKDEDVLPFLQNVTAGRGIPDERLVEVGEHYYGFGGRSPINDQNRALLAALEQEMAGRGLRTPIVWGNRNWEPYLTDAARALAQDSGRARLLAIDTSAYSSYSSCRQYREDFAGTVRTLADEGLKVEFDKIRQYYNHPGFAQAELACVREGLDQLEQLTGGLDAQRQKILYVTHSIPDAMETASQRRTAGYEAQHRQLIEWVTGGLGERAVLESELVFCSRSGAPHIPWSEPDVNDRMEELAEQGITGVMLVPMGFVSDHMEVKYDLDTEAKETARRLGMDFVRAGTVGVRPDFVAGLVDLLQERAAQVRGDDVDAPAVTAEGPLVPGSGTCAIDCCLGAVDRPTHPSWAS
ncbi:ferrochelatase [Brevibacterium jeotgali]|uniref:Coproporphyrin III ferrochelatase n=1 Tax=Brevibacterium jeotgali TaxID=1262550 RepID=A0A2H1L6T6_9MICO|nr:ferrochelatase [Brevibacterium jeotgali]SMY12589.1 ferrochelatase [Brevibacterium jeotgali]